MVRTRLFAFFFLLTGFIVVAAQLSVNKIQSNQSSAPWADGSPMPIPQPKPPVAAVAA